MSFTKIIVSTDFPVQYFKNTGAYKDYEIISVESFLSTEKDVLENALIVLPRDFLLFKNISVMYAIPNAYIVCL